LHSQHTIRGRKRRKKKAILDQITSKYNTRATEREKGRLYESNSVANSQLQSPKPVAWTTRQWQSGTNCRTAIHAPPREKEDAETNQMMRRIHGYNHRSQLHELPEGDKAVDKYAWKARINSFFIFFICKKPKIPLELNNNNKKKSWWNYNQALEAKVRKFK